MRILVAALLIPLPFMLATAADAQNSGMGGGSGGHRHAQGTAPSASRTPKADEKAYKDALKTVPNKPYDPWLNTR